jgi:lipopolysaccharide transport system permease protein
LPTGLLSAYGAARNRPSFQVFPDQMLLADLIDPRRHWRAYRELGRLLRQRRELAWELTKHEISERYAGQIFGTLWAIGHPLIMVAIYVVVFGRIFVSTAPPDPARPDQTTFLLAGLVPWVIMSELLGKACQLITGNAAMVKQLVFPIEVLPIKGAMASMISLGVAVAVVVLYALVANGGLLWSYVLLLPVMALQFLLMIGMCYILSAIAPFFRDLKDFITVFLGFALFISPVLYFKVHLPMLFQIAIDLNPFSSMIWVYQDVMWYGEPAHPWAWGVFTALALGSFSLGYRFFAFLKHGFAEIL